MKNFPNLQEMLEYSTYAVGSASISVKIVNGKFKAIFYEDGKQMISSEGNNVLSALVSLEEKAAELLAA